MHAAPRPHAVRRPAAPFALAASLALSLALAPLAGPARAEYRTLETDHVRLVYLAPVHSFIAPYAVRCFENSFRFHAGLFGWTPSEKVTVILDDTADYGNAAAWASPWNGILVYLAPANFVYETGPANERIHFAMNHELAHVVTLDQTAGTDRFLRAVFGGKVRETAEHPETMAYGYLTLPRRGAPRWHREGTAVFLETWMAGGFGRAQGPWDEMVFRAMVKDSTPIYDLLGLESEGMKVDFQAGVNAYLYGTRFSTYLAHEFGPGKFVDWVSRKPGSRAFYASQFRKVYGRPLGRAWRDWIAFERGFQRANLDSIRRFPVTPSRDLSPRPLGSMSRAYVDSAANALIAAVFYPGQLAHIASIPLDGGPPRVLHEVREPALYFVSSLAWDARTRTVFFTTDNDGWRDVLALDVATGRTRVLLRDARIGDLVFNPADRSLWGVRHFNGISTIVRSPEPWTDYSQAYSFPYGRDVYDLDISPDGSRLVGSMGEVTGRHSLRLWDTARLAGGDSTSRVLWDFGVSIPANFTFSPDGTRLYGTSYYTGVSNVFRWELAADSMDIVTNAETGFFRPIPRGGDSLIVFRYGGGGFVPAAIEARPLSDVSAVRFLGFETVQRHPELRRWKTPSPAALDYDSLHVREAAYRSLRSVRLQSVVPIVEAYKDHASPGLFARFSDPLAMHAFSVSASYSPHEGLDDDERIHATLGWKHGEWEAKARWNPASFYDLFGPTKTSRKGLGGNLTWSRELLREKPRTVELTASLGGWTGLEYLPGAQNIGVPPGFDRLIAPTVQLSGENLRSSLGAVDHEKGWKGYLALSSNVVNFVEIDNEYWETFPAVEAGLDVGTPLPVRNTSLWLRSAGGWADGARDDQFANFFFGGFGNNWVDHQEVKRYRETISFPGTELNAIAGTTFGKAMLDLNLPPFRFERLGRPAFYASWLRVSTFAGTIVTNPDDADWRRTLTNAGFQADLRLQVLTQQQFTLSGGYARAFEDGERPVEEWMISLKIL